MKRFGQFLFFVNVIVFLIALIHQDILALVFALNGCVWGLFYAEGGKA